MKLANPATPIPAAELVRFLEQATAPILSAGWRPSRASLQALGTADEKLALREASVERIARQEVNLGKTLLGIGNDNGLPNEDGNHIVHVYRRGIQIAYYVTEQYRKQTGMPELMRKNRDKTITAPEQIEYGQKTATEAAIMAFAAAYYSYRTLLSYKSDAAKSSPVTLPAGVEVSLADPIDAIQSMSFFLTKVMEATSQNGQRYVQNGPAAVRMATLLFEKVMDEIKLRLTAQSLQFTEPFTAVSYKLDDEDFTLNGFETESGTAVVSSAINPLRFDQIVGNRRAKLVGLRQIRRIACYNFQAKRNPYLDAFGEFSLIGVGEGQPGTGKTMLARAKATELARLGEHLGIPFLFWQLSTDIFDKYQGESAKKMQAWCRVFGDTSRIIYGLIDDGENVLKSREGDNVAEATEGVNSVFLNFSEGAGASRTGNWSLDLLTNLIHKFDKAVLSRIQDRTTITGAETVEDFLDQDYLWHSGIAKKDPAFVDMKDPEYVWMSAQKPLANLSELYAHGAPEPEGEVFKRIYSEVRRKHNDDTHMFYAELFFRIRQEFPGFTSRDVRNIQVSVNDRRMDFDLPDEWFEKRSEFLDQPYQRQVEMLQSRQRECLKGQSLRDLRLQETVRYLNVTLSIPEKAKRKEIEERRDNIVKNTLAQREAAQILAKLGVPESKEAA